MDEKQDPIGQQLVEKSMTGLNLIEKFDPSPAAAKPGDVCGGIPLWSNRISATKLAWTAIDEKIKLDLTVYCSSDKFNEVDGLHDLALSGKNARNISGQKVLSAEGWRLLFQEVYSEETELARSTKGHKLRIFGIRLAKTAPKTIFADAEWVEKEGQPIGLQSSLVTEAWTGAYLYFGAPWKTKDSFRDYLQVPGKIKGKTSSGSPGFFEARKARPKEVIDIFGDDGPPTADDEMDYESSTTTTASKTGPTQKKTSWKPLGKFPDREKIVETPTGPLQTKWGGTRKFSSFLKIKTTRLKSSEQGAQQIEFIAIMKATCDKLWGIDKQLVIFPWKEEQEGFKPIQQTKPFPTNRAVFSDFAEKVFLQAGQHAWIRVHVGHNKPLAAALKEDKLVNHFRQKDMTVTRDTLQEKRTIKAGWLLGSHTTVLNPRDLEESLYNCPEMEGLSVEIRTEWVSLESGDRLGLKAAHVLCEYDSAKRVRRAFDAIYGRTSKDFPLGRSMRFVPNLVDGRFSPSEATKKRVVLCVQKQRLFNTEVASATVDTILNLDYCNRNCGLTLRQALMQMRSKRHPSRNLFLAIDITPWDDKKVGFLFKKELAAEAKAMLSSLPLVLQFKLGNSVWDWFTAKTFENLEGNSWCPRTGVQTEGDDESLGWGDSLGNSDIEDENYWSDTSGLSRASRGTRSSMRSGGGTILEPFNITEESGENEYDADGDGQSVGEWTSATRGTDPRPSEDESELIADTASLAVSTSAEAALLDRIRADPNFAKTILLQLAADQPQAASPSPPAQLPSSLPSKPPPPNSGEGPRE